MIHEKEKRFESHPKAEQQSTTTQKKAGYSSHLIFDWCRILVPR